MYPSQKNRSTLAISPLRLEQAKKLAKLQGTTARLIVEKLIKDAIGEIKMEFYQIEWNHKTEVFENLAEARHYYRGSDRSTLMFAIGYGKTLHVSEVTLKSQGALWSENAKLAAENYGFDWEGSQEK